MRPQAVSLHTATYLISDAAQKAAEATEKVVGSVNAPTWVLPAAYVLPAFLPLAAMLTDPAGPDLCLLNTCCALRGELGVQGDRHGCDPNRLFLPAQAR